MAANDLSNDPHPDDLLGAYALHALDLVEEAQVEAHLEECLPCRLAVSRLELVAAQLGQSVAPSTPGAYIQSGIMEALSRDRAQAMPTTVATPAPTISRRASRVLMPVAAVLVLLFALSLVYNVRLTRRVDRLEMQNVSVSARLFIFSLENAQLLEALRKQEVSSYLLANPASQPMLLEPPQGAGKSQGVILVSDDGRHGILMVTGMPPRSGYQVWLLRPGERLTMGQVEVDSTGWGVKDLYIPEPLFRYERVELRPASAGGGPESGTKVLEGTVASLQSPK